MKRVRIGLGDVAELENLTSAFSKAAKGKRHLSEVKSFERRFWREIDSLRRELLSGTLNLQPLREFGITDPKPRLIRAPVFRERVLHHALMNRLGPPLDRALVDDTYACRPGKGTHAAIARVQQHLRRFDWFVKIDMASYFASIDHEVLLGRLRRVWKGSDVRSLVEQILRHGEACPGRGLPIGALTSQYFANSYLDALDRFLLETLRVRGIVRVMDDVVWWCDDRKTARQMLHSVSSFVNETLRLDLREPSQVQRSARGITFAGCRITRGALRLTPRRKRRYAALRHRAERAWERGESSSAELQTAVTAAVATTLPAEATHWRRLELARREPPDA